MKKNKLNLSELKVKSFVTDFENGKENTVKGGINAMTVEHNCTMAPVCSGIGDCPMPQPH